MDIIIDTNIIRRDLKLNDKAFEILTDYLAKTNSKLIFPSIVLEEVKGLYKRVLEERNEEYCKSLDKLKSTLLFSEISQNEVINVEAEASRYIEYLHSKLGTSDKNIVSYKNDYLPELVSRAIQRKKPMDSKGQQFRDTLLWFTLLDYAETSDEKLVGFISDNPSDFAEKGEDKLAKELIEEAESRGIQIKYFKTLNDFAKEQASVIDFINQDWVKSNLDFEIIENLFVEALGSDQEKSILRGLSLERNEKTTHYIERTDYINSSLEEFFVYEKRDGTIFLRVDVAFELEYEFEIEKTVYEDNSRYEYVHSFNDVSGQSEFKAVYIPDEYEESKYEYRTTYPCFVAAFLILIKDKKIDNYKLDDWDWA